MKDKIKFVVVQKQGMKQIIGRIVKQTITPYGTARLVRMSCHCGHPDCTGVVDQILLPKKMASMPKEERAKMDASLAIKWNLMPEAKVSESIEVCYPVFVMN